MPKLAKWCLSFIFSHQSCVFVLPTLHGTPSIHSTLDFITNTNSHDAAHLTSGSLHYILFIYQFFMVRRCRPLSSLQAGESCLVTCLQLFIQHIHTYLPNVCHDTLFSLYSLTYGVGNSSVKYHIWMLYRSILIVIVENCMWWNGSVPDPDPWVTHSWYV